MSFIIRNLEKNPYKLYERYTKELSKNPYSPEKCGDKCKFYCSKYGCSFLPFLRDDSKNLLPNWAMNDDAVAKVVDFMDGDSKLGFIGLSPSVLHDTWEFYMVPHLYELWCKFLYGDDENIIPDYKNFCLLVKGQVRGRPEERANIILQILLEKGFKLPKTEPVIVPSEPKDEESTLDLDKETVTKYEVIRYFYDLTASYLYGLGCSNNPEYLLWESCYAGLNERNLKLCMKYYTERMSYRCNENDVQLLLQTVPFLKTILGSAVSMMFGLYYTLNLVPFLDTPRETILDVSQATFLVSILRGNRNENYAMEMIYSQNLDGINFSNLHEQIIRQGPTFVIVKDESGYVFGGYASVSWMITSNFIGNEECFLFRLLPNVIICKASKYNNHFMYLNVPGAPVHGLGMGGHVQDFGLWIDLSSENGRCAEICSTWNNYACLSHVPNFIYVQLEIWRVTKKGQQNDQRHFMPHKLKTDEPPALKLLKGDYSNIIDKPSVQSEDDEELF